MAVKAKVGKDSKPVKKDGAKVVEKSIGYTAPLFDKAGSTNGEFNLPVSLFAAKANENLLAQAVRVYLSNKRTAQAKTKTRAEISRTTKKVYKQKGTGGARHGSRKAPVFVGGGIAHGPRGMQNYKLVLGAKMRKLAVVTALAARIAKKEIVVADVEKIEAKAKMLASFLKKASLGDKVTIIHAGSASLLKAGRNIKDVNLVPAANLSAYDCLTGRSLLFTTEAVSVLEKRFVKA